MKIMKNEEKDNSELYECPYTSLRQVNFLHEKHVEFEELHQEEPSRRLVCCQSSKLKILRFSVS
jgi:hypothetical protein